MEKEKNSIDDLFREVLHDHEITPSERAKEDFLKEVSEMKEEKWFRRGLFLYIALGTMIILGISAIYLFSHKSSESDTLISKSEARLLPPEQKTSLPDPLIHTNQNINNNRTNKTSVKTDQTPKSSYPILLNNDSHKNNSSTKSDDPLIPPNYQLISDADTNSYNLPDKTGEINEETDIIIPLQITNPESEPITNVQTPDTSKTLKPASNDTIVTQPPSDSQSKKKKPKSNPDWYFSLGIQYTPEWMFNTIEGGKYVNNLGAEGTFTYGKYSIRTGMGLSITKGTNELAVEYNDYLGSYNKLDSMSFSWDGAIHDYIPTYYLKSQDVYDSLMKLEYPKIVKRYTYLQIPVVFGYDVLRSGIFSFGLRAGPILSVLLYSKQLSEEYDPGDKKVISINDISPEQVSLNWQFMGGINASVRLSKKISFEIEPMAKYYFNSVYEKSDITKKPWSIGIRCAIIIKL